ncbi:uncharacterized protein F5891DRAFT_1209860 [Suillus fuscotomentosus]|uniref:Uncharacterized protein n=1 Tax=Suillus fuscotomentosus TaxID=1912939 RepID=A0AAD4HE21_9AGAM|nr:uncharacterized protein F5891DRAFT_1209851 [Suillus fuscotomentosus]XP_041218342.1 uncharacterized protein F5891DRAFT_1209860 [Suillus fuscotomentosus]KAG1891857.1 hypothetical protein F5891DRAFT_1209851 [Suillus fuscotomentosus]KAG1891866.1 hypothetical protein F5891DRAFT_1209860 [Suillus fuscotomentosus]
MSHQNLPDIGMAESDGEEYGFFAHNRLVKVCAGLDGFTLSSESDKASLLRTLKESASSFPPKFVSYRVLQCLASAFEFGASAPTIVPLVLRFGKNVASDNYGSVVVAPLVTLFTSADRGTRIALLDSLPEFVEKLDKKTVVDKIWLSHHLGSYCPHYRSTFPQGIPRYVDLEGATNVANAQVIRPSTQQRPPPPSRPPPVRPRVSIRTNTCILIDRLGISLGYNTKRKVLVSAFSMALKDLFVHAHVAGVMAFMATAECFEIEGVVSKAVPAIVGATLDKEKLVRDQAFKAVELFIKRLEAHASTMPETASTEDGREDPPARLPGAYTQAGPVNSATSTAAALTGSVAQLAPADMQTIISSTIKGSTLAPTINGSASPLPVTPVSPSANPVTNEAGQGSSRSWNDDLIDINADEEDWNAFEPAVESKLGSTIDGLSLRSGSPTSDEWGAMASSSRPTNRSPTSRPSQISRTLSPQPRRPIHSINAHIIPSMAGMSKEEKADEMARRKEERLLEQKKNAAAAAGKV